MRQVFITRTGGPEVLELREAPDPLPKSHALRIRVKAAGVNFADIMARKGLYPDAPKLPAVVGYEVSGVVDAVGPEISEDWLDKEVVALTRFGGYADTVLAPVEQVFPKPPRLTHAECAAIPVNYLTAWQLMVVMGAAAEGETVLIHNAGGGVGPYLNT
jgi:synaptic vesicle membrane protein VAT-1